MKTFIKIVESVIVKALQGLFQFWHLFISPLFGQRCRFTPSCSQYAKESLEVHGLLLGLQMSVKRIARCNSLFPGGLDPVVGKEKSLDMSKEENS